MLLINNSREGFDQPDGMGSNFEAHFFVCANGLRHNLPCAQQPKSCRQARRDLQSTAAVHCLSSFQNSWIAPSAERTKNEDDKGSNHQANSTSCEVCQ